jgi:hypothetical protein
MIITAAAGFLVAVLWFDLMFDVQARRHRDAAVLPDDVLSSIAGYYRRVTTTASPMGRLVMLVMATLIVALVVQAGRGDAATWVSIVSIPLAVVAVGLGATDAFRAARRLGARTDSPGEQTRLARRILEVHAICLACMVVLLGVQLAGG